MANVYNPATGQAQQAQPAVNLEEVEAFKNLKAEMSRKLTNTEARIDELTRVNQLLADQLRQANQPRPAPQEDAMDEKSLADLAIENPAAYAKLVEKNATKAAQKVLEQQQQAQARQNQIFGDIIAEFPEASNPNHELVKRAAEIHNGLGIDEKADPRSYKTAIYQAAAESGIKPRSKRKETEENDGFTLGGKGSSSRQSKGEVKLSDATLAFAKALGRPVDDPEYIKRLTEVAKRFS